MSHNRKMTYIVKVTGPKGHYHVQNSDFNNLDDAEDRLDEVRDKDSEFSDIRSSKVFKVWVEKEIVEVTKYSSLVTSSTVKIDENLTASFDSMAKKVVRLGKNLKGVKRFRTIVLTENEDGSSQIVNIGEFQYEETDDYESALTKKGKLKKHIKNWVEPYLNGAYKVQVEAISPEEGWMI